MKKKELSDLFDKLFPVNRSILGKGYRESLNILKKHINFKELKYRSEKKIFDWKVPKEWVIKDAYIKYKDKKIIDIKKNNLYVLNYSAKIKKLVPLDLLKKHLHTDKKIKSNPLRHKLLQKKMGILSSTLTKK